VESFSEGFSVQPHCYDTALRHFGRFLREQEFADQLRKFFPHSSNSSSWKLKQYSAE
jgi:hypothetical protein